MYNVSILFQVIMCMGKNAVCAFSYVLCHVMVFHIISFHFISWFLFMYTCHLMCCQCAIFECFYFSCPFSCLRELLVTSPLLSIKLKQTIFRAYAEMCTSEIRLALQHVQERNCHIIFFLYYMSCHAMS